MQGDAAHTNQHSEKKALPSEDMGRKREGSPVASIRFKLSKMIPRNPKAEPAKVAPQKQVSKKTIFAEQLQVSVRLQGK